MRQANGRYYLGRVHKLGQLDDDLLVQAVRNPATIHTTRYAWTIIDAAVYSDGEQRAFAFGKLSKYLPEGSVTVVDRSQRASDERPEPDLLVAASPFVFLPEFSAIAFLHVWNQIEVRTFVRRFCRVIEETYESFFVKCEVEPISDLRTFIEKLRKVRVITEISAQIHPPNPLFGIAWKSLRDYLKHRRAEEMRLHEKASETQTLNTALVRHMENLLAHSEEQPYRPERPIDVTDAALLMAADGYGRGKIVGRDHESVIVIRTTDTQANFVFDKEPDPRQLYEEARRELAAVSKRRSLDHER